MVSIEWLQCSLYIRAGDVPPGVRPGPGAGAALAHHGAAGEVDQVVLAGGAQPVLPPLLLQRAVRAGLLQDAAFLCTVHLRPLAPALVTSPCWYDSDMRFWPELEPIPRPEPWIWCWEPMLPPWLPILFMPCSLQHAAQKSGAIRNLIFTTSDIRRGNHETSHKICNLVYWLCNHIGDRLTMFFLEPFLVACEEPREGLWPGQRAPFARFT